MDDRIVEILKGLIEKEGPQFINSHPYESYRTLVEYQDVDPKVAGGVLLCILNGVIPKVQSSPSEEDLSAIIAEQCALTEKMSSRLSSLLLSLYSTPNKAKWTKDRLKGLGKFLSKEMSSSWTGFATWDGRNVYVNCHYEASFELRPSSLVAQDKELRKMLDRNPFLTSEEIEKYFTESLREYLDDEFEDYCTSDEYYEPCVEDFGCEYYIEDWCKNHGFEMVSFEGDGYDDGYESFR